MSTYTNVNFGEPIFVADAPRLESLRAGKSRWQCFLISYGVQSALLASLLTVTIASPVILPRVESGVRLVAPYLAPAPTLEAVRPTVHVVPVRVAKAVPVERKAVERKLPEPPLVKVEPPVAPVIEAPRPQRVPTVAHTEELAQPKVAPVPKFDSKLLKEIPGPKADKIIATNTFGGSSAVPTLHHVSPSKVQTGGFGDPNGVPLNAHGSGHPNIAALGSSFDLPYGPGTGNGTGGASGLRGTVASAGFGNGVAVQGGGGRGGNAAQGRVQSSGFASAVPPAATAEDHQRRAAAVPATTPVSIHSKPTPVYTAEARQLRVEGEVLLDVVFLADGRVRVLNVVRGLGHGLDEAAQRAAQGIHFSPATRDGHPVDSTAILHIVFQLS